MLFHHCDQGVLNQIFGEAVVVHCKPCMAKQAHAKCRQLGFERFQTKAGSLVACFGWALIVGWRVDRGGRHGAGPGGRAAVSSVKEGHGALPRVVAVIAVALRLARGSQRACRPAEASACRHGASTTTPKRCPAT